MLTLTVAVTDQAWVLPEGLDFMDAEVVSKLGLPVQRYIARCCYNLQTKLYPHERKSISITFSEVSGAEDNRPTIVFDMTITDGLIGQLDGLGSWFMARSGNMISAILSDKVEFPNPLQVVLRLTCLNGSTTAEFVAERPQPHAVVS